MSQVIGLAFLSPSSLRLVVRPKGYDARIFPGDSDWSALLNGKAKRKAVAIVEDKRQFKKAVDKGCPLIVVCISDIEWLERRGIQVLDAKKEGDNVVLDGEGNAVMASVTPDQIYRELGRSKVYSSSPTDIWLTKSNPAGRCAGCKHLGRGCGHDPTPTTKRPCGDEWERDSSDKAYRTFSLSQLLNLALNSAKEDLLDGPPKEFWRATYRFAVGKMNHNEWIAEHARMVKSAGGSKMHLQNIVLWVKRYGSALVEKRQSNPPSKLDVKLAEKLPKYG